MTREEAIQVLKSTSINLGRIGGKTAYVEALQMAIEALKAQDVPDMNDGDMIYKRDAIDAVSDGLKCVFVEYKDIAEKLIGKLPSAQPEPIKKAAYIRGFEQGRTQGMIDSQGGQK